MKQYCSVVPTTELTKNDWLRHGCISCIRERRGIEDLLKPIHIRTVCMGFGTSIQGVCCNGHTFSIQSQTNQTRKYSDPSISWNKPTQPKYIHYDCNILAVLAAYMNGDGGTEVKRIAASLNLRNFKSTGKVFDKTSKHFVGKIIIDEARRAAKEALIEEIHRSFSHKYPHLNDDDWEMFYNMLMRKQQENVHEDDGNSDSSDSVQSQRTSLDHEQHVELTVATDMGWQKRSSGRRYDSPSGHMFFVGSETNKILEYGLKCVSCDICDTANRLGIPVKSHKCYKNFDGHAKSMESMTTASLVTRIFDTFQGLAKVTTIVADDDSTMRSHCSHQGGLPRHVTAPVFLADPSHRCKVIGKPLFKLASMKKSDCSLSNFDATRLKIYTACFFNQVRKNHRDITYVMNHVWCILHHYFDDHQYCTSDFCYKKREDTSDRTSDETSIDDTLNTTSLSQQSITNNHSCDIPDVQNTIIDVITNTVTQSQETTPSICVNESSATQLHSLRSKPGYYRCMKKDIKLFQQLKRVLEPQFSQECLTEVLHGHNTQLNEGLNTSVSMMAPKYKNFSRTSELATRVAMVVGCHNLGKYRFIKRVIDKMNFVNEPTAFLELLRLEDNNKIKRRERQASIPYKRNRVRKRVKKTIEGRLKHIEAVKRGTTYGDNDIQSTRMLKKTTTSTCAYSKYGCGNEREPHKTLRSSHCRYHFLYKDHVRNGNSDTFTQRDWMEKVKRVWASENKESITNGLITTMDVINEEYDGDSSCLDSHCLSSNSSEFSEPDFDPSNSYSLLCEKKKMFSKCASFDSSSSSEDADMLSSSDEEDDDYNIDSNYHHSEKNDIGIANELSMFEEDINFVYNMPEADNTKKELETENAVEDENHVIV